MEPKDIVHRDYIGHTPEKEQTLTDSQKEYLKRADELRKHINDARGARYTENFIIPSLILGDKFNR